MQIKREAKLSTMHNRDNNHANSFTQNIRVVIYLFIGALRRTEANLNIQVDEAQMCLKAYIKYKISLHQRDLI